MVESTNIVNPEQDICFYEKTSSYQVHKDIRIVLPQETNHLKAPLNYPVLMAQNNVFHNELVIANTNYSLHLMDIDHAKEGQLQVFGQGGKAHTAPISALHCPEMFNSNPNLQHTFMTTSRDGLLKIWDRRQQEQIAELKGSTAGGVHSIISVTTNQNLICAGTKEDIIFWDVHSLQKPVGRFVESHNDEVTAVKFNKAGNFLITSSLDGVVNMFDLSLKSGKRILEDEVIDGAYSSTQALINCGFVNEQIIWAETSVNSIEFFRTQDATCFMKVSSFPHQVTYIIGCEVVDAVDGNLPLVFVYAGNLLGEVYAYTIANLFEAAAPSEMEFDERPLAEPQLVLFDMILTGHPLQVRQVTSLKVPGKPKQETFAVSGEHNRVQIFSHNALQKQQMKLQAQAQLLQELENEEML